MSEAPAFVPGLAGVPAARSAVSYIDGEKGILEYRGYAIEDLARECGFEEVCWLLLYGELPAAAELEGFTRRLLLARELPERLVELLRAVPGTGHPMKVLQAGLAALGTFGPVPDPRDEAAGEAAIARILGAAPGIVAAFQRLRTGESLVVPDPDLPLAAAFLQMLTGERPDELSARVLDVALVLHAEHTMNASTFAARVVASTEADPFAVCSSAIGALTGPLHGGANERVLDQLRAIGAPRNVPGWMDATLATKGKIMGFGHRVYKTKDPRARILQGLVGELFAAHGATPVYDVAVALEREVLERLGTKGIYPNVDFFSGILYSRMGIPTDLFTPIFGVARLAGYLAHWREQLADNKIFRPRQVYVGERGRTLVPLAERG